MQYLKNNKYSIAAATTSGVLGYFVGFSPALFPAFAAALLMGYMAGRLDGGLE